MRGKDLIMQTLLGGGSGGGSPAIVDLTALPDEGKRDTLYRLMTGMVYIGGKAIPSFPCYVVETLPEVGEAWCLYYVLETKTVMTYYSADMAAEYGVREGWNTAEECDPNYGGIITSPKDATDEEAMYILIEGELYQYNDRWVLFDQIGWRGDGESAEIFNSITNVADGKCSHAEGQNTRAQGDYSHAEGDTCRAEGIYSHAEGRETYAQGDSSHAEGNACHAEGNYSHAEGNACHAEGNYSHAEGDTCHAEGFCSHAEGRETYAQGGSSHAEGEYTHAEGSCSHAEGWHTHAKGKSQHVEGEYNIVDPKGGEYSRGKYVHVVGNGTSDTERSNAHTLDWSGNAWFAGSMEGTAAILKSSTSGSTKRFKITVDDSGILTATEVTE